MDKIAAIKLFGLNNLSIESEIRRIERALDLDLGHRDRVTAPPDSDFYPQFDQTTRDQAAKMAQHYQIFFCLENFIRQLIIERLRERYSDEWWMKAVPESVRKNAESNQAKERKSGVTLRSFDLIDYTNFGELGEIIKANWDLFGGTLRDVEAVQKILSNLNLIRAPIAHCKLLAEDEVLRLHLSLRDWFRQMG
jgi:hypothetical protein